MLEIEDILDFAYEGLHRLGAAHRTGGNQHLADVIEEVLAQAQPSMVSRYEGLGALVTFTHTRKGTGGLIERNFVFVPLAGAVTFATSLGDADILVGEAAERENTPRVTFSWWSAPNENAHGESKTAWTKMGETVKDYSTYITYHRTNRAKEAARATA